MRGEVLRWAFVYVIFIAVDYAAIRWCVAPEDQRGFMSLLVFIPVWFWSMHFLLQWFGGKRR